jgi:hypothetical protein
MRNDVLKTSRRASPHKLDIRDGNRGIHRAVAALARHDRSHQDTTWRHVIDRYLEGWAEANPSKILRATASGYWFNDPLIGAFSRWSLPRYFELLQEMLTVVGPFTQSDLAFCLHGPSDQASTRNELQFWREAPRIGLTGVTRLTVGEHGVTGESVAYDPNLASHLLSHAI